jgi:hypothetical protein
MTFVIDFPIVKEYNVGVRMAGDGLMLVNGYDGSHDPRFLI